MAGGVALAKDKKQEELAELEGPWTLPAGWCWAPLKRLSSFIGRGRGPKYVESGGVPVVNQKCIRWRRLETQHLKFTAREVFERSAPELRLKAGDLLWNSTGTGTIGRALIYDGSIPELTFDSHVTLVRPASILPAYLGYFVETTRVQHLVIDGHVGSTNQRELPRSFVEDLLVPLAPLAEQRRIVTRLDTLFAEIDEGMAALAVARKGLETFRRALLKAAVTGELTENWRAANHITETGHEFLARLVENRKDEAPAKGRGRRNVKDFPLDPTALPVIPKSWAWATVRDVGAVQLGRQRAPQHHAGENMRPYLRVANVYEDRIDFSDIKEMNFTPAEFRTYELKPGDILLNEGQTPDFLGRPAMWRGEFEGYCFQNTLLRFQARAPTSAEFCLLVFRHYLHAKRFKRESQITTNIAHLSSGRFVIIEFPVPPLDEQIEIVRRVSKGLDSSVDTLAMLDAEAADAARLKQSILKAAFEGRLLTQDATDEPASSLLARLQAVRATAKPAKRERAK